MPLSVEFGKYQLLERLASGGMGETWLAELNAVEGFTKRLVIKKMLPELAQSPDTVKAFIDEARLSATLSHGNIAQVFDFGQFDGEYYLAMEYVEGRSLQQVIKRSLELGQGRLPFPAGVHIVIELLKALHYAHTRLDAGGAPMNLVHRDVTPDNVLLSYEGDVKLVDFGVAKTSMRGRQLTEPGLVKGKYRYHSPEQALARPLDCRSDVFGAGILLFELLSGGPLFEGQGYVAMQQVARGDIPHLSARAADVDEELVSIVMRALAREPVARFQTALEMQERLSRWLVAHSPDFSREVLRELMSELFAGEVGQRSRAIPPNPQARELLKTLRDSASLSSSSGRAQTRPPGGAKTGSAQRNSAARWVVVGLGGLVLGGLVVLAASLALWPRAKPPVAQPSAAEGELAERARTGRCVRIAEQAMSEGKEEEQLSRFQRCVGAPGEQTAAESNAFFTMMECKEQRAHLKTGQALLERERVRDAELRLNQVKPLPCTEVMHQTLTRRLAELRRTQEFGEDDALFYVGADRNAANAWLDAKHDFHEGTAESVARARRGLEGCVKNFPAFPHCHWLLARVLFKLDECKLATAEVQRYLKLLPAAKDAELARQELARARASLCR